MSFSGKVKEELLERRRKNRNRKKTLLTEAFLSSGSLSDPEKSYHFEIVCREIGKAQELIEIMREFELDAKLVERKAHYVVYLKEGEQIADMLRIMGAYRSCMDFENVRIVKEMRNSVNRQVNCETANIHKTVGAAVRQIEDIRLIEERQGLSELPKSLREMAEIRLQHPDAPLLELGNYFSPPIGKSGVNHRLRKITEIAEKLR